MGNLVTKITTNNVQLDESNASEFTVYEQQVKKEEKSPVPIQTKNGIFKTLLNIDPRSPSLFITRTPITIFQRAGSKFNHKELNNSLNLNETNESVDLDILTAAEQESLNSNKDLTEAIIQEKDEILEMKAEVEQPAEEEEVVKKSSDDNLMKKITDKLISAKINENSENKKTSAASAEVPKKKLKEKNLIFEDDNENLDRFSTPPKKLIPSTENERTPLSCVANTQSSRRNIIKTSTPKSSKIPVARERQPVSATRIPRKI